jgi:hypothetical protein
MAKMTVIARLIARRSNWVVTTPGCRSARKPDAFPQLQWPAVARLNAPQTAAAEPDTYPSNFVRQVTHQISQNQTKFLQNMNLNNEILFVINNMTNE